MRAAPHQDVPSTVPARKDCAIRAAATALQAAFLAGKTDVDSSDNISSFGSPRESRADCDGEGARKSEEDINSLHCGYSRFG